MTADSTCKVVIENACIANIFFWPVSFHSLQAGGEHPMILLGPKKMSRIDADLILSFFLSIFLGSRIPNLITGLSGR